MRIQLKATNESPIQAYRRYDILLNDQKVGTFGKGADRRWNAQLIRNRDEEFNDFNRTSYAHSSYQAMIRLIACYLLGDMDRVQYLARGIWINPCPVPEIVE